MEQLDEILNKIGVVTMEYYSIDFDTYLQHLRKIKHKTKIYIDHQNKVIRNEKAMTNYFNCIINFGTFQGYIDYNQIEII